MAGASTIVAGVELACVGGGLCCTAGAAVFADTGRVEPGLEPGRAIPGAAAGAFGDFALVLAGPTLALTDTDAAAAASSGVDTTVVAGLAPPGGLGTRAGEGAAEVFLVAAAAGACLWTLGRLAGALDSPGATDLRGCVDADGASLVAAVGAAPAVGLMFLTCSFSILRRRTAAAR